MGSTKKRTIVREECTIQTLAPQRKRQWGGGNLETKILEPTSEYRVRKLTERECWRLMGVKDEDFEKVQKSQSKSKLYHLAGDSIVTTCLMAIFGQMLDVDWEEKIREVTK